MIILYFVFAFLAQVTFAQECFLFNYTGVAQQFDPNDELGIVVPVDVTINSTVNSIAVKSLTGYTSDFPSISMTLSYYYTDPTANSDAILFSGVCSGSSNFNLGFNESAATTFFSPNCNPVGTYQPSNGITAFQYFQNKPTNGTWTMIAYTPQVTGNITGYGLNICPNYFNLALTSVNVADRQVNFIVNSDATDFAITSEITLNCGNGQVTSGFYDTSTSSQQLSAPSGFGGLCNLTASVPYNTPFFTDATTSVYVVNDITTTFITSSMMSTTSSDISSTTITSQGSSSTAISSEASSSAIDTSLTLSSSEAATSSETSQNTSSSATTTEQSTSLSPTTSTSASTSTSIALPTVSIVSPQAGAVLVAGQDALVYFSVSDDSAPAVSIKISRGPTVIGTGQGTSSPISINTDSVNALGAFDISIQPGQYVAGNSVSVFFYRQLVLSNPTERSFVGGQSLPLNVTSIFPSSQQISFIVKCPSKTIPYYPTINTELTIAFPADLSGIGCTFSTTDIPEFYLPIQPVSAYIALSQQQTAAIVQQFGFANFQVGAVINNLGQIQKARSSVAVKKLKHAFASPVESKLKYKIVDKRAKKHRN